MYLKCNVPNQTKCRTKINKHQLLMKNNVNNANFSNPTNWSISHLSFKCPSTSLQKPERRTGRQTPTNASDPGMGDGRTDRQDEIEFFNKKIRCYFWLGVSTCVAYHCGLRHAHVVNARRSSMATNKYCLQITMMRNRRWWKKCSHRLMWLAIYGLILNILVLHKFFLKFIKKKFEKFIKIKGDFLMEEKFFF